MKDERRRMKFCGFLLGTAFLNDVPSVVDELGDLASGLCAGYAAVQGIIGKSGFLMRDS
jgi:hypothetical protein